MPFKKGNKLGGRRSGRTSNIVRSPTPPVHDDGSDEEMLDGDADDAGEEGENEDMEEDAATPAQNDDDDADSPPTITTLPRRRGGRGRASRRQSTRHDRDTPDDNDASESGTPRRKRGRPFGPGSRGGRGGFRGRRRGQQPEAPRVIDRDGNALNIVNDEAVVDDDAEGNEKVDETGLLQGGREYRVRTFKIMGKGDRLYMLSTEPARCCGFRDSYLFFTKHPKLFKVVVADDEKKDLIDRNILPSSYKGRNIGVVTARSVFREFGARIIVGGRKVIDDYKVEEARAHGEVEGELADPEDRVPDNKDDYNRNRYVAWFGASDVYRTSAQANSGQAVKPGLVSKRRANLTVQNWQHVHSREASRFNSAATALRHANRDGVYDINTNMMLYPKIMQPTHARWEQIPPPEVTSHTTRKQLTNGLTNGHDISHSSHSEDAKGPQASDTHTESYESTIFCDVPAIVSRNFTVIDTVCNAPPISQAGYPGPDGHVADIASGPNGLDSIPGDVLDELPEDCRRAFEEARRAQHAWKAQWGTEKVSASRGNLIIGLNGCPV